MKKKVIDAEEVLRKVEKRKLRWRSKVNQKWGKNTRRTKNLMSQVRKEAEVLKKSLQMKNKKKVNHLMKKYLKTEVVRPVPEKLSRYKNINLFKDKEPEKDDPEVEILVIGDVELDDDTKAVLKLPPKYAILKKLAAEEFKLDEEMSLAKLRYAKRDCPGEEEDKDQEPEISPEEQEQIDIIAAEGRRIFSPEDKEMDFRNKRVTDLKENSKVHLPKPLSASQEAKIEVRREKWNQVHFEYKKENCNDKDEQKSNLTIVQRKGLAKLLKLIREGVLLVLLTDKSGKLAVSTVESYLKMGQEHIKEDKEVDQETVRRVQRRLNGHMSMWLKMSCQGEAWNHQDRMRETCLNSSCSISPLHLLIKDHKKTEPGDLPRTRPVCDGTSGMDVHLSNHLSEYLEAIAEVREDKIEVNSTEDLASRMEEFNEIVEAQKTGKGMSETDCQFIKYKLYVRMKELGQQATITGADAKALYPSLQGRHTARIVRDATLKSSLEVKGMDWQEVTRYVAMGYDPFEKRKMDLGRILPVRRYHKGATPGVTGAEPLSKNTGDELRWVFPGREPTAEEKKRLLAAALEIGVRAAFACHLYQFGGRTYHQRDGGPIGTRLAGAAAKIVMMEWADKVMEILEKEDIPVFLAACYVDDVRFVTGNIEIGKRWNTKTKRLEYRQEWVDEDNLSETSRSRQTAREMTNIMNSVYWNIQFEPEIGEDFTDSRLPTLDLTMWLDQGDGQEDKNKDRLVFSFFEKEMASVYCIMETSALSETTKISSLSQDLIRRMLNTSERVPQEERDRIIEVYTSKLYRSGYKKQQVREIIEAGLKGYETKLAKAAKTGTKLHRPARTTAAARQRKKLLNKTTWFKTSRKAVEESVMGGKAGRKVTGKAEQKTEVSTVLFVERTWNGELARRLKLAEAGISELTGDRVKVVEKSGTTLKDLLHQSNPWAGQDCGREDCMICEKGDERSGDCKRRNITYRTFCLPCAAIGKKSLYIGETARTGHERGLEHRRDYGKETEDSHMTKHWLVEHPGQEKPSFGMKVVRSHRSAFARQIHEAVLIEMGAGDNLLNSKGEYNRCELPRLRVEIGQRPWVESGESKDEMTLQEEEMEIREDRKRDQRDCQGPPSKRRRKNLVKAGGMAVPRQMDRLKRARGSQGDDDVPHQETPSKRKRLTSKRLTPAQQPEVAFGDKDQKDELSTNTSIIKRNSRIYTSRKPSIIEMFEKIVQKEVTLPAAQRSGSQQNSNLPQKPALNTHPAANQNSQKQPSPKKYKANPKLSLASPPPPHHHRPSSSKVKPPPAIRQLITAFFPPIKLKRESLPPT